MANGWVYGINGINTMNGWENGINGINNIGNSVTYMNISSFSLLT